MTDTGESPPSWAVPRKHPLDRGEKHGKERLYTWGPAGSHPREITKGKICPIYGGDKGVLPSPLKRYFPTFCLSEKSGKRIFFLQRGRVSQKAANSSSGVTKEYSLVEGGYLFHYRGGNFPKGDFFNTDCPKCGGESRKNLQ